VKTLVVDDEVLVRVSIERLLKKWDHMIIKAESVSAARLALEAMNFDRVIVDLRMPGENGMVLIEELLLDGYLPEQLIVCSAHVSEDLEEQLNKRGIGIVRKPFTIDELMEVVNAVPVGVPVHSMQCR
jgi:DNA-binding NtrC family response regulator